MSKHPGMSVAYGTTREGAAVRAERRVRRRIVTLACVALFGACTDGVGPTPPPPAGLLVSNPVPAPATTWASGGAVRSATAPTSAEVVYVSLPPDSIPDGGIARITNIRTGATVQVAMANGGFDPVAVMAHAGDSLTIRVEVEGGGLRTLGLTVPLVRAPVVVRTQPPPRKRDVPLNSSVVVVFSEPMSPSTAARIQLLRDGAPVSGTATLSSNGLRVTIEPSANLDQNTDYVVSVPASVADLSGDSLQESVAAEFTTGTTTAVASVFTALPALFINPLRNEERTFDFEAFLDADGRVNGSWSLFYAASGVRASGHVTCFAIADGNAAWVGGVVDYDNSGMTPAIEQGWRLVDNGPPDSGVADQLSFVYALAEDDFGTAQNWCATRPMFGPSAYFPNGDSADLKLFNLSGGDLVVAGATPSPPPWLPPGVGMSQIAYTAPSGRIWVRRADGTGVRALTTDTGDSHPAWSPDGLKLAFHGERATPGNGDIYVMNYDGSALTQLTSGPPDDREPAWSPDGSRMAFDRDGTIQVMSAVDGSGIQQLTAGPDHHPSWSPDGTKIAFAHAHQIYVMNADGSGVNQLTTGPGLDDTPAWSPDGTRIAFQRTMIDDGNVFRDLTVMNADGTGVIQLGIVFYGQPAWSPDGKEIVYANVRDLSTVNADGTGMRWLGKGYAPAWSPVGTMPSRSATVR